MFQTSAIAFTILKFIGAGYLILLAWQAFRAPAATIECEQNVTTSCWKLYLRGIIMNISNPKVSIFFLAFLPQFTDPLRGSITIQLLLLGSLFIISTILVFGSVAVLGGSLGHLLLRSGRKLHILNKIAGSVFLGLALKLAVTTR
ncbi:LysE family translocator [Chitinispirillales bacterium ANBcel5]|uniref:LysE family translocator n=1 Tax=Cellulosispirillum alkaliphilum TaxID=3039283 RepID=UPI002A5280EF|nr:LysE family translocator [Chitinispirillales bacterium ANBcel5]